MLHSAGTTILRVNATDLDILENARVTYYIGPGGRDNFRIVEDLPGDIGSIFVSPNAQLVVDNPPTYYNVTVYTLLATSDRQLTIDASGIAITITRWLPKPNVASQNK